MVQRQLLLAIAAMAGVYGFMLPALPASQRQGSLLLPSTGAVVARGVRVCVNRNSFGT